MRPSIEVTIVTYNSAKEITACLTSVAQHWVIGTDDCDVTVAVWDNLSHDSTADLVAQQFPDVRLHRGDANLGFGQAQNALIATSTADYVMLLNPDTVVDEGSLSPLLRELQNHDSSVVAGPLIYSHDGVQPSAQGIPTLTYECATLLAGRRLGALAHRFLDIDRVIEEVRSLPELQTERREVPFLWATCWLLRQPDAARLGPFSPAFFLYDEDLEVCSRLAAQNQKVVQVRASRIFHEGGASSTSAAKNAYTLAARKTFYRETGGPRAAAAFGALQAAFARLDATKRLLRTSKWLKTPSAGASP